jgi:hypothetical protein
MSLVVLEDGPTKSQNSGNISLLAEDILQTILVLGKEMLPLLWDFTGPPSSTTRLMDRQSVVLKDGPTKFQNSGNISLPAENILQTILVLDNDVCFHSIFDTCSFIVVYPCFITCNNPLQEGLSFFHCVAAKAA